jgi:hypothetical protein
MKTTQSINHAQHQHTNARCIASPCKMTLIGTGIIFIIGSIVATWLLYPQFHDVAFSCLSAVPIGIALIIFGFCHSQVNGQARRERKQDESNLATRFIEDIANKTYPILSNKQVHAWKFFINVNSGDEILMSEAHVPEEKLDFTYLDELIEKAISFFPQNARGKISCGFIVRNTNKTFDFHGYEVDVDAAKNAFSTEATPVIGTTLKRAHDCLTGLGIVAEITNWDDDKGFV